APVESPDKALQAGGACAFQDKGPLVVCAKLRRAGGAKFYAAEATGAGEVPPVAAELLQIFAEVAVDKAKRKGFELIRSRIHDALCAGDANATIKLPRTCALIDTVRLEDLAAQAQALRGALVGDLLALALTGLPTI